MPKQKTFKLEIVTPNGTIFSERVLHVNAPGEHGRFGVLVNHIPLMIMLGIGHVVVQAVGENRIFSISGGVAQLKDNHMKILAKSAEDMHDIDVPRARQAKSRAEKRLSSQKFDQARAKRALARAENRLATAHPHQH